MAALRPYGTQADPTDCRAVLVHITEEGRKIGRVRHEDRAHHPLPLIGELTPEEQRTIAAALPVLARPAELGMRARQ
ncbi:hypothetical protein [Streptomyces diastatochromogenes]|uniref:hypothetical protein n=1 Tax=Streptomyces diastatochromogenes TaxID=42236 RepID=UPI0036CBEE49